jgi:hypothetical protein
MARTEQSGTVEAPRVALAFVALNSGEGVTLEEISAAWSRCWPEETPLVPDEDSDDTLSYSFDEAVVAIAHVAAPIPSEAVEQAARQSWMWPEAGESVAGHTSHLIVTVLADERSPVERLELLSRVIVAIIEACEVAAVHWGAAGMLIEPSEFRGVVEESCEDGMPPLMLWVNLLASASENEGATLVTLGMQSLGLVELEVLNSKLEPADLLEFVGGVVSYLAENGPVLQDGETIGLSEDQKVTVEHTTSAFNPGQPVIRLHA